MGPESLLDNAPNYLVGSVIQKRICTSNEFLAVYCVENVNATQVKSQQIICGLQSMQSLLKCEPYTHVFVYSLGRVYIIYFLLVIYYSCRIITAAQGGNS